MIEFSHATFAYEGSSAPALRDFSLCVGAGECVVLCGKSGCGKSTALRLVNGMIPNFYDGSLSGSVSVAERDPFECEIWELAGIASYLASKGDPGEVVLYVDVSGTTSGRAGEGAAEEMARRLGYPRWTHVKSHSGANEEYNSSETYLLRR